MSPHSIGHFLSQYNTLLSLTFLYEEEIPWILEGIDSFDQGQIWFKNRSLRWGGASLNQSGDKKRLKTRARSLDPILCSLSPCHHLLSDHELTCLEWPTIAKYFSLFINCAIHLVIDNINFLPGSYFSFSFNFQHSSSFRFRLLCNYKLELIIKILMESWIPCYSLCQI